MIDVLDVYYDLQWMDGREANGMLPATGGKRSFVI
jgi:hypothetical protein